MSVSRGSVFVIVIYLLPRLLFAETTAPAQQPHPYNCPPAAVRDSIESNILEAVKRANKCAHTKDCVEFGGVGCNLLVNRSEVGRLMALMLEKMRGIDCTLFPLEPCAMREGVVLCVHGQCERLTLGESEDLEASGMKIQMK